MAKNQGKPAEMVQSDAQRRKQRRRSVALALCIGGLAVLFYVITLVKMGPAIFSRAM